MAFTSWLRSWQSSCRGNRLGKTIAPKRPTFHPQVERLEDRLVPAGSLPFTFLAPGFTQELYGTTVAHNAVGSTVIGGSVAFAGNGDPVQAYRDTDPAASVFRFNSHSTIMVHGSTLHPVTQETSDVGLGITNSKDGGVYTNTLAGVVKIDPATGGTLAGPFGPGGTTLGIATDPQTGNLVYAGGAGVSFVDPGFTTSGTFATGFFFDGIFFDPSGNFLFGAQGDGVTILRRNGSFVQHISLTAFDTFGGVDGIAFHSVGTQFVLSNNNDGSITRFDFPGNDFTKVPTQTLFAKGGFRGDITQVGPDGFLYLSQLGTRFDDGTVTGDNSLVRIGFGFAAPPGVGAPPPAPSLGGKVPDFHIGKNGHILGFIPVFNVGTTPLTGDFNLNFSSFTTPNGKKYQPTSHKKPFTTFHVDNLAPGHGQIVMIDFDPGSFPFSPNNLTTLHLPVFGIYITSGVHG